MSRKSQKHRPDEESKTLPPGDGESSKSSRSGENLFRILSANYMSLSQMADTKAHIMLTICAGVITLSMGRVFQPESARYAAIILVISALISAMLAVLSTLPRYGRPDIPHPDHPRFNLLFFNHFTVLSEEEFTDRMQRLVKDGSTVREALLRDIYLQGKILASRKFRYLILSYRVFLVGIVVSGVIWVWGLWRG